MSCDVPLDRLVMYWSGEDDAVEDHQWSCDACTRRLAWIAAVGDGVAALARRRGGIQLALTRELVARLEADGVQLRHYRFGADRRIACTVSAADDLVVSWYDVAPLADERVDLAMTGPDGVTHRAEDLPVDRARGQVVLGVPGDFLRTLPDATIAVRVLAVGAAGERSLGDYTYEHTAPRA